MNTQAARLHGVLFAAMAAVTLAANAEDRDDYDDDCHDDSRRTFTPLSRSTLGIAWASSRSVGSQLYRHRVGIQPGSEMVEQPAAAPSAKGGMSAKGGAKVTTVSTPQPHRWEVFGSLFYYTDDQDAGVFPGIDASVATGSLDLFGGSAGVEYHINRNWSIGLGLSAAQGDTDLAATGSGDVDSFSIVPFLSYHSTDTFGSADLWADLLYSYGMHSYELQRFTDDGLASGSPDADTHMLELNVGLNFGDNDFVHGPYAGMRYITGSVDAYTEVGPGSAFFGEEDVDSLVSILGYQVSWKMRGSSGFWVPQLRAAWEHEFEDGNVTAFGIPYQNSDEDIGVVGAGIGYWWDNGWHLGLEYEGRFGSETEAHYGGLTAGKEF